MKKINKSSVILGIVTGTLILLVVSTFYKFLPVILHKTVYYCQEFITTLSVNIPQNIGSIIIFMLSLLFITGIIKFSFILIKTVMYLNRFIKNQDIPIYVTELAEKLNLENKIYILESSKPFAFCFGFFSPKIYLSRKLLTISTPEEVEVVIRHELYHLKNRDTLTISFVSFIHLLFPFFPILKDLIHNYKVEREIRADQEAIQGIGNKKDLISLLKKLLQSDLASSNLIPAIGDQDTLEQRILAIKGKDTKIFIVKPFNVLLSIVFIIIILSFLLMPVQAIERHNHKKDIMMVCLNGEACAQWCAQHNIDISEKQSKATQISTPLR